MIGAGAVGVCCAYFLARAGRSVRVLERDRICSGSSWGNSGLVTTSSCAPEAAPGVIGQALRWLLEPQGPFRLRPRIDAALLRWLWRFRAQCTPEAAERSTRFLRDRVRDNAALVDRIAAASPLDFGWRRTGLIALYATERGLADGIAGAAALGRLEIPSQQLDAPAVARLEPRITGSVLGGILYPEDAHLDPGEFVTAVAGLARAHGARIDEGAPVVRLHGDGRIEAVETPAETIRPHVVVLANGAWAPALARGVRLQLLVEAGKGFSLTYPAGGSSFERPLRLGEVRTVVSTMCGNVRVTSKLDLVGVDTRVRERRVRSSEAHASRYVGLPTGASGARTWAGLRPLTPDGLPLLGRSAAVGNLVLATGHGHLGISLAAVTGDAVTRIVAGDEPAFDLGPVRPERSRG